MRKIRVTLAVGEHTGRWQEEDVYLDAPEGYINDGEIEDRAIDEWEKERPGRTVAFLTLYAYEYEEEG